jgi:DNA-binding protein HU-beta
MPKTKEKPATGAEAGIDDKVINKGDFIVAVAEATGLPRPKAASALTATLDMIGVQLSKGVEVRFGGFGSFAVSERKAGKGRDPRTGAEIDIPASKTVRFRASKGLRDIISGKVPEPVSEPLAE